MQTLDTDSPALPSFRPEGARSLPVASATGSCPKGTSARQGGRTATSRKPPPTWSEIAPPTAIVLRSTNEIIDLTYFINNYGYYTYNKHDHI